MSSRTINVKINADIASLKTKMNDAKKSISDLIKTAKDAKMPDNLIDTDLGKKIENAKNKLSNFAKTMKALPGPVKAAAVIAALLVTTKKLYEAGKQRFFEGLNNIKDTVSPVFQGMLTSINAVKDAFSEITGFDFNLSSIITTGVNFEAQMKKVATIAGSVGTELDQLINKARELGASTTFSATEVGEAMEYMAMAGWSTSEMLDGVQSTLNLAKIGATDLGTASDILTDDLTALGMQANQAGDFADKLSATITRSNTNVELFGESMKQTGAIAGALGASMTDLSTSIGIMANAGIKGSKAGMSLKNMLSNMANPTDQQDRALQELGMTADKTGSYLKTTADGCVDLEATVTALREGTEKMTRSQKAALIATVAGKNALPGVMSLVNASAEEYNKLSDAIDNSTSTVSMFNENMSILGLKGQDATDRIEVMKTVFSNTELSATALGLSAKDLGYAISLLGDDSKVTSSNVEDLFDVIESMDNASGKTEKIWRNIGNADDLDINKYIDYNSTISEIENSIVGLTEKDKEHVKSLIKENMTVDEANKVLKKYGLSAQQVSLSTLSTSEKMDYLRYSLKDMSNEQRKAQLKSLGLADSFDEVNEIVSMSDDKYKKYKENLETIQGLSDRLAKSIDETTKSSFLALSSAIEDSLLGVFDRLKPALMGASEDLTDFFSTWRGQDGNYSFSGFESGIEALKSKVQSAAKEIPNLISDAVSGANRFISGGALQGFLDMGSDIVQNIGKGIIQNKEGITQGISDLIARACSWIQQNMGTVEEAGKVILTAIGDGIRANSDAIDGACEAIYNAINSWSQQNSENMGLLGGIVADKFIFGFLKGFTLDKFAGLSGFFQGLFSGENTSPQGIASNFAVPTGEAYANGVTQGIDKNKDKTSTAVSDQFKNASPQVQSTATEIGNTFSNELIEKLKSMDTSQLKALEDELKNLQSTTKSVAGGISSSFTNIRNSVRENLVGCTNIGRNQFVSLANIIKNQSQNARNSATTSFISMKKVISTQVGNARNIVTSKMISINKVVATQSQNARNNATKSFISLAKVIRTQMANAYNSVNTYMNKISASTNRTLSTKVNVTKTVNTVNTTSKASVAKFSTLAANSISSVNTMSLKSVASPATISNLNTASSNGRSLSSSNPNNTTATFVMPVYLDSKMIGKSTAKIIDGELKTLNKKNNRKRGV